MKKRTSLCCHALLAALPPCRRRKLRADHKAGRLAVRTLLLDWGVVASKLLPMAVHYPKDT